MTGRDRQTIADAALMVSGSAEAMFAVARRNSTALDICIDGMELEGVTVEDKRVVEYYARNGIVPANSFPADDFSDDSI